MIDLASAPQWLQAVILGLAQGLTEFLPISSSGHLVLIPHLAGWQYMGKEFDVALHVGTLVAVLGYFRAEVAALLRGALGILKRRGVDPDDGYQKLVVWLIVATIPAGVIGLFLHHWLEDNFSGVASVATFLALFALIMGVAEAKGAKSREIFSLTMTEVILVGCAQALALMPGVSRSGATMTACLMIGLTRAEAARFSFLMALPVTAAAILFEGLKLIKHMLQTHDFSMMEPCLIGIAVSGVSGWLCIAFLLRYLRNRGFAPFIIYRLLAAAFLFVWVYQHGS